MNEVKNMNERIKDAVTEFRNSGIPREKAKATLHAWYEPLYLQDAAGSQAFTPSEAAALIVDRVYKRRRKP